MNENLLDICAFVKGVGKTLKNENELTNLLSKKGRDVKSAADEFSDNIFKAEFSKLSKHPILSEESGFSNSFNLNQPYWVLDPLDGTMNYTRGFPMYCISVALIENGIPSIGIIYDIVRENMYTAFNNEAKLNDNLISVSEINTIDQSILATGFPLKRNYQLLV